MVIQLRSLTNGNIHLCVCISVDGSSVLAWGAGISVSPLCSLRTAMLPTKHSMQALFCAGLLALMKSEHFPDLSKPVAFQLNRCAVNENAVTRTGQAEANRAMVSWCLAFLIWMRSSFCHVSY